MDLYSPLAAPASATSSTGRSWIGRRERLLIYSFSDCVLDTKRYVLRRDGEQCHIEPQVFQVLVHLVRRRGQVVSKDELFDKVWGRRFVSDAALTSRIRAARKAIGDSGSQQALIRTVHGKGYEFIAPVVEMPPNELALARAAQTPAEPGPPEGSPSALPAPIQSLIGRAALLDDLRDAVGQSRLLTLTGLGGVGKTALAYQLARQLEPAFPDGACAVEFVTVTDNDAAIRALATALHIQSHQGISLDDTIVDVLRPRQTLLLLDNCEHLAEPLATLVDRILRAAPKVTVVATSREPLAVPSERLWPVEPLPVSTAVDESLEELRRVPAIALFAERAAEADPEFLLDDTTATPVAEICRRLDGIPLAIELAAARARTVGVGEIARRLDERFRLLKGVRRGADPRHQTLQDALRWSFDLLAPDEQQQFCELSVFAGQFELADAAAVCGGRDELDALDLITSLAERSMVTLRRTAAGGQRYELLETLRAYASSQLADQRQVELFTAHSNYYANLAEELARNLDGPDERSAVMRADGAFPDLRAAQGFALEVDDADTAYRLTGAAREYAMRTMRYEALAWADSAIALRDAPDHPLRPTLDGIRAYSAWMRGDFTQAIDLANAVEAEESRRGEATSGLAQRVLANVYYVIGEVEKGFENSTRQLKLAEADGNRSRIAHATYMHSVGSASLGRFDDAAHLAHRALAIGQDTGSPTDLASGYVALGFAAHDDVTASLAAFAESERIAQSAGNRWMATFARTEASGLLLSQGQLQSARTGLAEAVDIWHRAGEWSQQWLTLSRCVVALTAIGELELAAQVIGAIEQRAHLGIPPVVAFLRDRALAAATELSVALGDDRYQELHAAGSALPIVDVVHRTRSALLGRGAH